MKMSKSPTQLQFPPPFEQAPAEEDVRTNSNTSPNICLRIGPLVVNTANRNYIRDILPGTGVFFGWKVMRGKLTRPQNLTLRFIASANLKGHKPTAEEIRAAIYDTPPKQQPIPQIVSNLNSLFSAHYKGQNGNPDFSHEINMIECNPEGEYSFSTVFPVSEV